ncbi:MAG TPA: isoprenylcysteine carboxylmethyltransferase family protein [Herpetosiphonaceae bacterium]
MSQETWLRVVFAVVVFTMLGIRAYYRRRAAQSEGAVQYKESRLNIAIQWFLAIGGMLAILAYVIRPSWIAWAALPLPLWLRWLAALVGVVSLPLLVWVQRELGNNFSTVLHVHSKQTLVTSGPYRTVRHPMYTVLFLLALSMMLIAANWSIGFFWLGGLLAIVGPRIRREEAVMLEQFGDQYRDYMRRTNRFLPRLAR